MIEVLEQVKHLKRLGLLVPIFFFLLFNNFKKIDLVTTASAASCDQIWVVERSDTTRPV